MCLPSLLRWRHTVSNIVQKNIKQLILDDCALDDEALKELTPIIATRGHHGVGSLSLWHNTMSPQLRVEWLTALQGHDALIQVDLPEALVNMELAKPHRPGSAHNRYDYPMG